MKKITAILLAALLLLSLAGCGCTHEWNAATCDTPKTCSLCDATEGAPAGHSWMAATCAAPKTCENCGETEGTAKEHTWQEATTEAPKTCSVCGKTEGEPLSDGFEESYACLAVKTLVEENLGDYNPRYEYSGGVFYVHLDAPEGTALAMATAPELVAESWQTVVSAFCEMSASGAEVFETAGYEVACSMVMHNDSNAEKILLGTLNGEVVFDASKE